MSLVIIVDDQPTNRMLFAELARSIGPDVVVAAFEEPETALQECRARQPDLVITDYKMNGMDGDEFVRRMRSMHECNDVPVIVLTVYDDRAFRIEALKAGATDFLLSPVDHSEFLARARNLLKLRTQQKLIESRASVLARELERSESTRLQIIRQSHEALAQVIDTVPAFIMAADRQGLCVFVNAGQAGQAGGKPQDFVGRSTTLLLGHERGVRSQELDARVFRTECSLPSFEEEVEEPDGSRRSYVTSKTPLRDAAGGVASVVTTQLDITSRKQAEERMRHMALHDELTDLPNRSLLDDRLRHETSAPSRGGQRFALLFLDLDRFKAVNDGLGHHVGDWLLQQVSQRLRAVCRAEDTVARLGGDEFAVLQTELGPQADPSALAARIIEAVSRPIIHGPHVLGVTASVGVTMFPADGTDVEVLKRNADLAMYQAKAEGKNTVRFYEAKLNERIATALRLEAELRDAAAAEQFELRYQPQVDLRTGRITGFEALLRWKRPGSGLQLPGTFLPIAEESGLIAEIGVWVLRTALRQAVGWRDSDGQPMRIAVNLSPVQFMRQDVFALVRSAIEESGFDPHLLDLELTEGTLLDDSPRTMQALRALSAYGVLISIDDFGTGYASLSYIKRVPISRLKIDRSFIRDFPATREDAAIVGSVVALGRMLGVPVLAEGVETRREADAVRDAGCVEMQGYLISPPMEAAAVPGFLHGPQVTW